MTREFTATPAVRKAQNLFIGLVGASSSGKTWTALELAKGIQAVCGGEIALIDTENNRALAYADAFRNRDGTPGFQHIPFEPPWGSLDYVDAIEYAAKKAKTIIIDSASHEHDSEGGMLDFQEQEVERMAKGDAAKAERVKMLAWAKPKAARRKLLRTITRLDANVIMCFRAKNSSKPGKDASGRAAVIPMGFVPIAGDEFVFEMALSALFLPGAKGVPTWDSEFPGERLAIKIPHQFEWLRENKGPLNFDVGKQLAEWARGGGSEPGAQPSQRGPDQPIDPEPLRLAAEQAAKQGNAALTAHLRTLPKAHQEAIRAHAEALRATAAKADENASAAHGAQTAGPDIGDPAYELETGDGIKKFYEESTFLSAYEAEVRRLYTPTTQATLLRWDQANKPRIEAHPELAPAIAAINRRLRAPAQPALGV